jgi:hypothetical protein
MSQADQSSTYNPGTLLKFFRFQDRSDQKNPGETRAFFVAGRQRRRLFFFLDLANRLIADSGLDDSRRFLPHSIERDFPSAQ